MKRHLVPIAVIALLVLILALPSGAVPEPVKKTVILAMTTST